MTQVDNMSLSDSVELPDLESNDPIYYDDGDTVRPDGEEDSKEDEESSPSDR